MLQILKIEKIYLKLNNLIIGNGRYIRHKFNNKIW